MVNWACIEDASAVPNRVWLSREKPNETWKPLRKVDCKALNGSPDKPVLIESGRAMADPEFGVIRYHFFQKAPLQLTSATWFVRDTDATTTASSANNSDENGNNSNNNKDSYTLIPMAKEDAQVVEEFYQRAIYAASSLGKGLDPILKEEAVLPNKSGLIQPIDDGIGEFQEKKDTKIKRNSGNSTTYVVTVEKNSEGHYVLKQSPKGWFAGKAYELQRGYGAYTVQGEAEEELLGPVQHLVFVIHGIGEAMWSREDFTMSSSLLQEVAKVRLAMQRQQIEEWKQQCKKAKNDKRPKPPPPNRVELIPIIWYNRVHSSSNALMKSLQATTLTTIPALREIANDVIFDVLMYMTPNFCYDVLECVTDQIIEIFAIFQKTHPRFAGKCSLIGHSLGSVICWDLLSMLKDFQESSSSHSSAKSNSQNTYGHGVHVVTSTTPQSSAIGYQQYASGEDANQAKNGSWGPTLSKPLSRHLPFVPDFTLFLGSPIGLFLTLRGAHAVFDDMRKMTPATVAMSTTTTTSSSSVAVSSTSTSSSTSTRKMVARESSFDLPCGSMHNIFHPSDPVAYRIEPLLLIQGTNTADLPEPLYLTRDGQDVRLHVKAKQIGNEIKKSIVTKTTSITSFMNSISESAQTFLQQMEERSELEEPKSGTKQKGEDEIQQGPYKFPLAGRKSKKGRIDFQLQPRIIDSEYLSAVMAHSSYFSNKDVIDYIIDLTRYNENEQVINMMYDPDEC